MKNFLSRVYFASKEAFRNLRLNYSQFFKYLISIILTLNFISLDLIIIFNFNYLGEVFSTGRLPDSSTTIILPFIYHLNNFKYALYFILIALIFFLFYLNKDYLGKFIDSYKSEIELIDRLNGDWSLIRLPLLYTTLFINIFSIILAWILSNYIYKYFSKLVVFNESSFGLLSFRYFKITLLVLLLIIGAGVGLVVAYYLMWVYKHKKNYN